MAQLKAQIDKILSNVSSAYIPKGYISEMIFPVIKASQYTGLLAKYGNSHLRIENSIKGGRGKYRRVESITRSTSQFQIEGHGLEGIVTKEDKINLDKPYNAERDEVLGITTMLWLEKEKLLADAVTNTTTMTQNQTLAGTSQFSDYLNSDPLTVFDTARQAIRDGSGNKPNGAIMDYKVFSKLRYHPQMLDSLGYKHNRPGGLKMDELASAMDVDKLFIGDVMYNSAKEGQTDVLAPAWGKHIVFGVLPDSAVPYQVSLGYRVQLEGSQPRKVTKWPVNNPPDATAILVEDEYDHFLSNVLAGYLIENAIA